MRIIWDEGKRLSNIDKHGLDGRFFRRWVGSHFDDLHELGQQEAARRCVQKKLLTEFTPGRGYTKKDWDEVSDNPELTDEELNQGKLFAKVFPEMAGKIDEQIKRTRGAQKAPTKALVSLRVDRDVLDAFRASGAGWQARMNEALRAALPKLAGE